MHTYSNIQYIIKLTNCIIGFYVDDIVILIEKKDTSKI